MQNEWERERRKGREEREPRVCSLSICLL